MNAEESLRNQLKRSETVDRYPPTTIRLSRAFKDEVRGMAVAHRMSMNAFIVLALDDYLVRHRRPPLAETDPEFIAFLRREKGGDR